MSEAKNEQRHSHAEIRDLIQDRKELAEAEARNGLRQFDLAKDIVTFAVEDAKGDFKLRTSHLMQLQQVALEGISGFAGTFRPGAVEIKGSNHTPPENFLVPELVQEMCDYVNNNWNSESAIHLAAYVMWRLNWIHPFADGNGRTSRIASHAVLCIATGYWIPGTKTIPEMIAENRDPYYEALDAADIGYRDKKVPDLSPMETLLETLLAKQLLSVIETASGNNHLALR